MAYSYDRTKQAADHDRVQKALMDAFQDGAKGDLQFDPSRFQMVAKQAHSAIDQLARGQANHKAQLARLAAATWALAYNYGTMTR